ncbi:MAG: site-specific integrase [Ekhidna sp.]|nr:site-specific integrase [Ekhidna sp.]
MHKNTMSLHDRDGRRKYLNQKERLDFLEKTKIQVTPVKLFCQLLYYTGARISEIYNLSPDRIDLSNRTIIIESLKKRKRGIFREIPLPDELLHELEVYCKDQGLQKDDSLWPFSLRTASRYVKQVMRDADIKGVRSCAKGLRHGFAVHAVSKAPLTLVKKWLGHATLKTTEIYLDMVGVEERRMAEYTW